MRWPVGWLAGCRVMWLIVMMACLQLVRLAGCPATSQTGRLAEWKGEDWLPGGVVGLLPGGVALDDWGCGGVREGEGDNKGITRSDFRTQLHLQISRQFYITASYIPPL